MMISKRVLVVAGSVLTIAMFAGCCGKRAASIPEENVVKSRAKDTTINGIECVLVEAGTFIMGRDGYISDTRHEVTIPHDFYIGKYEVTQAQYMAVMGTNPSTHEGDNKPVENVSWFDAVSFCQKVKAVLPTVAEWEFAASGGNSSKGYMYSGSDSAEDVAWMFSNSYRTSHDVGTKMPNELGIYDMSGNVREWCSNSEYSNEEKMLKGGCYICSGSEGEINYPMQSNPDNVNGVSGFRVVFPVRKDVTI
jgi:formylglycine-generating enzyme required for sulfatase activity